MEKKLQSISENYKTTNNSQNTFLTDDGGVARISKEGEGGGKYLCLGWAKVAGARLQERSQDPPQPCSVRSRGLP